MSSIRPRRALGWRFQPVALLVALLIIGGTATILYPSTAAWLHQYRQSQVIRELEGELRQSAREGLAVELEAARRYNDALTTGAIVGPYANAPKRDGQQVAAGEIRPYAELLRASATGSMARLRVPAIDVDLPILHGTSDDVLLQAVGHLQGTALPVGGSTTHSVLTAHRGLAGAELFTRLNEVQIGDTFTVEVFGEVLTYRVRQTQVVEPSETQSLFPVLGEDLVTLVTCTPLGINTQRILVTGQRVTPTPIADLQEAGSRPEIPGFPWWAVIFGAVLLAASGYVIFMGYPRASLPSARSDRLRMSSVV